jgi:hypothetical protein
MESTEEVAPIKPVSEEEKQLLKDTIKEWIKIDNELREIAKFTREKKQRKKEVNDTLMNLMRSKNIHGFDTSKDGSIMYVQNKVKVPLNKKHLLEALSNVFEGSTEKAEQVSNYILESRQEKLRESIKRKITKSVSETESVSSKSTIQWKGF